MRTSETQHCSLHRPPICNLKKYGWLRKNSADIFGLAELSRKLKKSVKIRLNTKNCG